MTIPASKSAGPMGGPPQRSPHPPQKYLVLIPLSTRSKSTRVYVCMPVARPVPLLKALRTLASKGMGLVFVAVATPNGPRPSLQYLVLMSLSTGSKRMRVHLWITVPRLIPLLKALRAPASKGMGPILHTPPSKGIGSICGFPFTEPRPQL